MDYVKGGQARVALVLGNCLSVLGMAAESLGMLRARPELSQVDTPLVTISAVQNDEETTEPAEEVKRESVIERQPPADPITSVLPPETLRDDITGFKVKAKAHTSETTFEWYGGLAMG